MQFLWHNFIFKPKSLKSLVLSLLRKEPEQYLINTVSNQRNVINYTYSRDQNCLKKGKKRTYDKVKIMEVYKIKGDTDMVKQKFLFKLSNGDKGSALQTHKR